MPNNQKFLEELLFTLIFIFLFLSSSLFMIGLNINVYNSSPSEKEVLSAVDKKSTEVSGATLNKKVEGENEPVMNEILNMEPGEEKSIDSCEKCSVTEVEFLEDNNGDMSLGFSGTSFVDLSNVISLDSTEEFTLKFMIKPDFDETSKDWKYIFSDSGSVQLFYMSNLNDIRLFLRTDRGIYRVDTKGLTWDPNMWYELSVVYDGATADIYWNGTKIAEGPARGKVYSSGGNVLFGISQNFDNGFTGELKQMYISKTATLKEDMVSSKDALIY